MGAAFGLVVRAPSVHTLVANAQRATCWSPSGTGRSSGPPRTCRLRPRRAGSAASRSPGGARSGLGRALTEAALEALGPRETVLLLASDAGRPIYERLGFEGEGMYRVFMSPDDAGAVPARSARSIATPCWLWTRASRARRRALAIDAALDGVASAGRRRFAPAVAARGRSSLRDPGEGAALLAAVLEPGLRLAVPEANVAARGRAASLSGARSGRASCACAAAPPVPWRPTELWGVFSLFFG